MGLMNSAQDSLMCIVHGRKVNNCAKKKKKKKGNMMYKTQMRNKSVPNGYCVQVVTVIK